MHSRKRMAWALAISLVALTAAVLAGAMSAPADDAKTTRYKEATAPASATVPVTATAPAISTAPAQGSTSVPKRARERTIAPFPVPGDTSALSALRWRTLNLPRSGITTVAPLPVPGARRGSSAMDTSGLSQRDRDIRERMAKHEGDCDEYFVSEHPEPIHREDPVVPDGVPPGDPKRIIRVYTFIGEDGRVEVAETHGAPSPLDSSAVACVLKWRFQPARHCGHAMPAWVVVPLRFNPR